MPIALRFSSKYPALLPPRSVIIERKGRKREREKDLENRVNFLRREVSHSPLIGRGEGSVHHIFSLKAFTRMESSFIPSKVPTREFLSIRSLSHFQPPQTGESSFEELEVNSLSLFFFRSVSWSYPRL